MELIFFKDLNKMVAKESPLRIYNAKKGIGSFVTFDVNHLSLIPFDRYFMHIWIYLCDWKVFKNKEEILNSDEQSERIFFEVMRGLNGKQLLSVNKMESEMLQINISDNYKIILFNKQYESEDDWVMIYLNNGKVICYSEAQGLYIVNGSEV